MKEYMNLNEPFGTFMAVLGRNLLVEGDADGPLLICRRCRILTKKC